MLINFTNEYLAETTTTGKNVYEKKNSHVGLLFSWYWNKKIVLKNTLFDFTKVKTAAFFFIVQTRGQGSFTCNTYLTVNLYFIIWIVIHAKIVCT
jgi:hypothetical protein